MSDENAEMNTEEPSLLGGDDGGNTDSGNDNSSDGTTDTDSGGSADTPDLLGAPDSYEDFTLPEGVEVDKSAMSEATAVFKDAGLSQENAQKLVDLNVKMQQSAAEQSEQQFKTMLNDWVDETKADSEVGGDKFEASVADARKAISAFGNDAFREIISSSGLGNHVEMVRVFAKIGKLVSEDGTVKGQASTEPASITDLLYLTMKK